MTRTCPYCGTKLKKSFWLFVPEKVICPTCCNYAFQPVRKQLDTLKNSFGMALGSFFLLKIGVNITGAVFPQWFRWMMSGWTFAVIPWTALLIMLLLQCILTRDRHVQQMYEKEQHKETPNGT